MRVNPFYDSWLFLIGEDAFHLGDESFCLQCDRTPAKAYFQARAECFEHLPRTLREAREHCGHAGGEFHAFREPLG
jgi:hypothetical protein